MSKQQWADDESSSDDENVEQEQHEEQEEVNQKETEVIEEGNKQQTTQQQSQQQQQQHYKDNDKRNSREEDNSYYKNQKSSSSNYKNNSGSGKDLYQVPNSPYVIYVGNLSYQVTDDILGSFFVDGGCNVLDAHVYQYNGRSNGFGVVIFEDENSFNESKNANNADLMERKINVRLTYDEVKRHHGSGGKQDRPGYNNYNNNNSRPSTTGRGDIRTKDGQSPREGQRDNYRDRDNSGRGGGGGGRDQNRNRDDRRGYGGGRGGRDGGRDNREHRDAPEKDTEKSTTPATPEVPTVRKALQINPRTLPVEKVGEVVGSPSGLFGSGKPRDELEYVCRLTHLFIYITLLLIVGKK